MGVRYCDDWLFAGLEPFLGREYLLVLLLLLLYHMRY